MATSYCTNCGQALVPGNPFCSGCGAQVVASPRRSGVAGPQCHYCHAEIDPSQPICPACGQVIGAPAGVRLADLGRRLGAYVLDLVLVFLTLFIGYIIWWLFTLQWGQTPGKQLLGIRVIKVDGTPSGWGWTFIRELVIKVLGIGALNALISLVIPFPIFTFLDPMWAIWDRDRQALHDKVMKTIVVDDRDLRITVQTQPAPF